MSADQPLYLRSLTHTNFRNLKSGSLTWSKRLNVILGQNGSGKTNVLEAIYFLATAKSFRTHLLRDLIQTGQEAAKVEGHSKEARPGDHLVVAYDGDGRQTRLNGEVVPVAEYIGRLPVLFYSTTSLRSIEGYPEERRQLLDRGIFLLDRGYLKQRRTYRHILQQKRSLLRGEKSRQREHTLRAWNRELAAHGAVIIQARRGYTERLNKAVGPIYAELTGWKKTITLQYRPAFQVQSAEEFLEAIDAHERDPQARRFCLVGPHRDDLDMRLDGRPIKAFASMGEKRAFLLALALAERDIYRSTRQTAPILLLDDINAELDPERIERGWALLKQRGQVFVTSTNTDRFPEHGTFYTLKGGTIHAQ